MYKTNTTGQTGVTYDKIAKKYRAYIHFAGEKISLGYHTTLPDAINARRTAEEFYKSNSLEGQKLVKFLESRFVITNASCVVMQCLKDYDWSLSFPVYVLKHKDKVKGSIEPLCLVSNQFALWMDGTSLRRLAKASGRTIQDIKKEIQEELKGIQNEKSRN